MAETREEELDGRMPFLAHLGELRQRIIVSLIAVGLGFVVTFEWFEEARNRYLEAVGLPPLSAATPGPVLVRLEAQYRKPLAYPDEVLVTARTTALRRTSVTMEYAVWRDGRAASCVAVFVLMVAATGERTPIPPAVRAAMIAKDGAREE